MRLPPAVHVSLGPSRRALVWVGGVALLACVAIAMLPFDPVLIAFVTLGIGVWAGDRAHVVALRRGPRATRSLWLSGDRMIVVRNGAGQLTAGCVRTSTYVGARLTTIVWRPDGARRSRAEVILPDMLPANDFRRLRVLLRYGRSDDTQGAPASQAD
jgi:hypothetical protein